MIPSPIPQIPDPQFPNPCFTIPIIILIIIFALDNTVLYIVYWRRDEQKGLRKHLRKAHPGAAARQLATLSQLDEPKYGYSLIEDLSKRGLEIEQGTLYPLLRRLEEQGLLESEWNVAGSRPRRYYIISPDGRMMFEKLKTEWGQLSAVLNELLS